MQIKIPRDLANRENRSELRSIGNVVASRELVRKRSLKTWEVQDNEKDNNKL